MAYVINMCTCVIIRNVVKSNLKVLIYLDILGMCGSYFSTYFVNDYGQDGSC